MASIATEEDARILKPRQLELITEPFAYHGTDWGFFSVVTKHPDKGARQSSYPLSQLPDVLGVLPRDRDTYISQAEFRRPNRRVINLARVGLMFVDIDPGPAAHLDGDQWAMRCLMACRDEGIPAPSLIVYSGRGVHLKWLLDRPVPRAALPRWNHAQKCLVGRLAHIGADAGARDASRVLRLTGTINTKVNRVCQIVWEDRDPRDGELLRHSFDTLFEELVEVPRHEYEAQLAAERQEREDRRRRRASMTLIKGGRYGLRCLGDRQLAWDRLEDLRKLAQLRASSIEGQRMLFLHWSLNFLALAQPIKANHLHYEARVLAKEIAPGWSYQEAELGTVFSKAKAYAAGERIEFNGRQYPPLYTPRNDTLIRAFDITEEEQRQLKTVISKEEARRRDAERKRKSRLAAGAVERSAYLDTMSSQTEQRRETALKLRAQGLSQRAIAKEMGITQPRVAQLLKGQKK
ncbi:helix-turn-helix domain-containing protein [Modicisalibacter sp. 'Wilcox']|uniref:helix-turn-helix domain-containing protein n=1 Tax=Modicisalibacter sp. 'Wilcox' TaxID=2679914 RepID=UPI0013D1A01C|nr:helix-turn-helix domain-containing protein [Modicisalibacter sp. 'Wilcox']